MSIKNIILALFLFCCLSACGFHLETSPPIPPAFKKVCVMSARPYDPFTKDLRKTLRESGAKVVLSPVDAPFTIHVQRITRQRVMTSVSADATVQSYNLTYTVDVSVEDKNGVVMMAPQEFSASQSYTSNTSHVLGNTEYEDQLFGVIRKDVITNILIALNSEDMRTLLNKDLVSMNKIKKKK